jgi:glycosyltransferase involved in cell wall biosynthesis
MEFFVDEPSRSLTSNATFDILMSARDVAQMPFVSVIIPTYHDWERLRLCLDALRQQTYEASAYEVIVINNDPDDSCPYAKLPGKVTLLSEAKPGSYAARNAGIRASTGEILAFTDADCIPAPNWIEAGVARLLADPALSRIGGRVELTSRERRATAAEAYDRAFGMRQDQYVERGGAMTANMFAYRSVFDAIGLFMESRFSGEDTAWGQRAEQVGWRIAYAPECAVTHPARWQLRDVRQKIRRLIGGRLCDPSRPEHSDRFWLVRGLVPPVFIVGDLLSRRDLGVRERIGAYAVYYYVKLYQRWCWILLKLGVHRLERL